MPRVFSYGSLQRAEVQQTTLGRVLSGEAARLPAFALARVPIVDPARAALHGASHYANVVANGRRETSVSGMVLEVTDAELVTLDGYEAADGYARVEVSLAVDAPAWVYVHAPTTASAAAQETLARQAAFYRAALWLGLVPGAEVVTWAERLLVAAPDAPAAFVDLAVVDAQDVSGLRHALLALGPERPPWPVVQAIFGVVGRQLTDGLRTVSDTCTVLTQTRQWLPLPAELADELKQFELARLRESHGEPSPDLSVRVGAWLARFSGTETPFASA